MIKITGRKTRGLAWLNGESKARKLDSYTGLGKIISSQQHRNNFFTGKIEIDYLDEKVIHKFTYAAKTGIGPVVGNQVRVDGYFQQSDYGLQLKIETIEFLETFEVDNESLSKWLAQDEAFKGIGPVAAARISALGYGELDSLIEAGSIEDIKKLCNISQNQAETLKSAWQERKASSNSHAILAGMGLTEFEIAKVLNLGLTAAAVAANPYSLIGVIRGFGWKKVDAIALKLGIPKDSSARRCAGIMFALDEAIAKLGNTAIGINEFIQACRAALLLDGKANELITESIGSLINAGKIVVIEKNGEIYYTNTLINNVETGLAVIYQNANKWPASLPSIERFQLSKDLNLEQITAIRLAFTKRLSVVTGPAGSGKTTIVKEIAAIASALNIRVVGCAFTGGAARRLSEATGIEASTVHRLIKISMFGKPVYTAMNPLPDIDILVIDEASMLASELTFSLLSAVNWAKTNVVMLGDLNQLPPIEPGAPFHDLISSKLAPVRVLTEVHRQSGLLLENASALLDRNLAPSAPLVDGLPIWRVKQLSAEDDIIEATLRAYCGLAELVGKQNIQIICPVKGSGSFDGDKPAVAGSKEINHRIKKQLFGSEKCFNFNESERVVCVKNSYELTTVFGEPIAIMNGDTGVIIGVSSAGVSVAFEAGDVWLDMNIARDLIAPAYCLTAHRTQGRQYPYVILVLPLNAAYTANQQLIYTAITRAQKGVIILHQGKTLYIGLNKSPVQRKTALGLLL